MGVYGSTPTPELGPKSELLNCLNPTEIHSTATQAVDAKILDGAAVAQMLKPCTANTFQNYADLVFMPSVKSQLETADKVDIVWDVYLPDSLKTETRQSIFLLPIGANHKPAHC